MKGNPFLHAEELRNQDMQSGQLHYARDKKILVREGEGEGEEIERNPRNILSSFDTDILIFNN